MEESKVKNGTLAILNDRGTIVGTGFLIGKALAVTCAHVIQQAHSGPGGKVQIRFEADESIQTAFVDSNFWNQDEDYDIAGLLIGQLPNGAEILRLGYAGESPDHPFYTFGYSKLGDLVGLGARGQIIDTLKGGQLLQITSQEIDRGMSGSPVIDINQQAVVGMILWLKDLASETRNNETNIAVTSEVIIQVCSAVLSSSVFRTKTLKQLQKHIGQAGLLTERAYNTFSDPHVTPLECDSVIRDLQASWDKHLLQVFKLLDATSRLPKKLSKARDEHQAQADVLFHNVALIIEEVKGFKSICQDTGTTTARKKLEIYEQIGDLSRNISDFAKILVDNS